MSYTIHQDIIDDVAAQEWENYIREKGIRVVCVNKECTGHGVTRPGEPETYYLTESQLRRGKDFCGWCARVMEVKP